MSSYVVTISPLSSGRAPARRRHISALTWPRDDVWMNDRRAHRQHHLADVTPAKLECFVRDAVELFGLLGGGVMGDLAGLPKSQFAVLPGTTHVVPPGSGLLDHEDWVLAMIGQFLDAPLPEPG